ncbi:MAG: hypothetical protein K0S33_1272 [Bacteroidetes bacterium]|jgi:hypothetical protein|nr:hypothetical protein [Bacteroidota bacterium]
MVASTPLSHHGRIYLRLNFKSAAKTKLLCIDLHFFAQELR